MYRDRIVGVEERDLPLVVGVDLGGTQLRASVLRGSTLLSRVNSLTGHITSPDYLIPRIFQAVQRALHEAGISIHQVDGVGLGVPGPVNGRKGIVFSLPNLPGWDYVALSDILANYFPDEMPIIVENDANSAGLGEYLFGKGRGYDDMIYLTISTGIGSCVIIDGQIVRGKSGTAGELGHMTIDWNGERCGCGNIGCLERIASGTGIALRAKEMLIVEQGANLLEFVRKHYAYETDEAGDIAIDAEMVGAAAKNGIPLAREIISRAGYGLGVGLVNIIHMFNPERIILGGSVTLTGSLLLDPAREVIQQRAMTGAREDVSIDMAELGADAGIIGAGALIYHHVFSSVYQRR